MELNLNSPPKEMSLAPIDAIATNLDRIFGKGKWENYELETISLELGFALDELSRDKLNVLQIVMQTPEAYFEDVLFYLHAVEVINNNIADFDKFPLPTSLEIAYAHVEMRKLFPAPTYSNGILKTIKYILDHEGYSEPVWPFNEMGLKIEEFTKGQEPQDTKNKEEAIKRYIQGFQADEHRDIS
jgi:hypothetical protein